jgi:hypothetical protein
MLAEVRALGKVLAEQTVGVLIAATLLCTARQGYAEHDPERGL